MNYIVEYHNQIKTGKIIVSKKVRTLFDYLVWLIDGNSDRWVYDEAKANRPIEFIEQFCKHDTGKNHNQPFILELWQKAIIAATFGIVDFETGKRKYREMLLVVARKNGKSTLAAAIGLYMLMKSGEYGAEIYSAATKRDQAAIIWDAAVKMIKKSPALYKRNRCLVNKIVYDRLNGVFKPLSSESNTLDGLNVYVSLIDELHAIQDKNLYDVIIDGMIARDEPLSVITTTAGTVRDNIFDLKYEQAERALNNMAEFVDDDYTFLPVVYELDHKSEWTNSECWAKANPGLGTIKKIDQLENKVMLAKANDLLVKNLLCKDFNIRETSHDSFLSYDDAVNTDTYDMAELKPRYAIGGVDLSSTTDLTCATVLFKTSRDGELYAKQMYWIPEDTLEKHIASDKVPYDIWVKRGLIRLCPGNMVDYQMVIQWFHELRDKYNLITYKIGYDAWSAQSFASLMTLNFGDNTMDVVRQGAQTLSTPMKQLGAELKAKNINYDNNDVLKWCLLNVEMEVDKNYNIKPRKPKNERQRIDGFASLLDAYVEYDRIKDEYLNLVGG